MAALAMATVALASAAAPTFAADAGTTAPLPKQAVPEALDMLRHAVAFQTVAGKDQVPAFARYLADKLESAGFARSDIEILPVARTAALVVRYPGRDANLKPILISGHMDVVAANPADWERDPFQLVEENGYLYGRGVADMKAGIVTVVATFMRLKREGFVPRRGMLLVFSGDEETEMASTRELARRYHDAEFLLNADAGGGTFDAALKPVTFEIQAAEKTYADFELEATSPGGHSSAPTPDNAIYRLSRALTLLAAHQFPVQYNEITLASLKDAGEHDSGPLAEAMRQFAADPGDAKAAAVISANPAYVGQLRTTCVATTLAGGHALNALPQRATANINCRIFPGMSVASVRETLAQVIADPTVAITVQPPPPAEGPASPLRKDVIDAVSASLHAKYPRLGVVPGMSSGATDSMYFRIAGVPSYGVSPDFAKPNDTFAHGRNEKLLASNIPWALRYWHSLLRRLSR
ncbi:MAG: M20/M25/M40 family metallo-hydrolase [Xanthomonadaceae bacterium]|nr:M20/M25/M40 family metallo-hydrolase [Xanthomonadaceae bacterium]